jgi:hypothetical protein
MRSPEGVDDSSRASNIVTAMVGGGCDRCRGRVVREGDVPRQRKGG